MEVICVVTFLCHSAFVLGVLNFQQAKLKGQNMLATLNDPSSSQSKFLTLQGTNWVASLQAAGWTISNWSPKVGFNYFSYNVIVLILRLKAGGGNGEQSDTYKYGRHYNS